MLRLSLALALLTACGSKTGLPIPRIARDASVSDVGVDLDVGPDTSIDVGVDACVPFRAEARLASLDIFVLMDSSGSMVDVTVAGDTKAEAITEALDAFFVTPESEGIGVSLTFFPELDPDVPELCGSDSMCGGVAGACIRVDVCAPDGEELCRTDADCSMDGSFCQTIGFCAGTEEICLEVGEICPDGSRCFPYGYCENQTRCDEAVYARPTVPVGLLPDHGRRVTDALRGRALVGGTPTRPALAGAIADARRWSEENPANKVIVLLATDGFPAACDDSIPIFGPGNPSAGIDAVVEAATLGVTQGIETFVIGVFTPEEEADARNNLSRIAVAGGSDEALIVSTREPVVDMLIAILNEVRGAVRTCSYSIPSAGVLPDPTELRVSLVSPMRPPMELRRVRDVDACTDEGGYFFPVDIGAGARPGFVELCPSSCARASLPEVIVEMQAGCD